MRVAILGDCLNLDIFINNSLVLVRIIYIYTIDLWSILELMYILEGFIPVYLLNLILTILLIISLN